MPKLHVEPVGSRSEIKKRVKAARAYAGYGQPRDMATHPAMKRNGVTASRVIQIEAENIDASEAQLRVIAQACELPYEWFTADYRTLEEGSPQLDRIEETLKEVRQAVVLAEPEGPLPKPEQPAQPSESAAAKTSGPARNRKRRGA